MTITFEPLHESHFPLLLKWLEMPHVKKWWDQDVTYTMDLVREKYSSRIPSLRAKGKAIQENTESPQPHSLLRDDDHNKPIQAFIIHDNQKPVGYFQIYNAYDFPRSKPLSGFPENLGAFDIFIGEKEALQRGLGSKTISEFLRLHGNRYSHIFADPDSSNIAAVKCYEKAGFKKVAEQKDTGEIWMIKQNTTIIYLTGKPGVGKYTIAKELASRHGFIVCDNQLINNPIFELLQYDGYAKIPDSAWEAIGNIRRCIFTFLAKENHNSYVLTNNLYEDSGDKVCYAEVVYMAETRGSLFVPVRLLINQDEHLQRVVNPNRSERWKSIDPQDAYDETPLLSIVHPNLLQIDVSNLSPEDAAGVIMNHVKTLRQR